MTEELLTLVYQNSPQKLEWLSLVVKKFLNQNFFHNGDPSNFNLWDLPLWLITTIIKLKKTIKSIKKKKKNHLDKKVMEYYQVIPFNITWCRCYDFYMKVSFNKLSVSVLYFHRNGIIIHMGNWFQHFFFIKIHPFFLIIYSCDITL